MKIYNVIEIQDQSTYVESFSELEKAHAYMLKRMVEYVNEFPPRYWNEGDAFLALVDSGNVNEAITHYQECCGGRQGFEREIKVHVCELDKPNV